MTDLVLKAFESCPSEPSAQRLSATIGIARVICILGIVYVHAWTGLQGAALAGLSHDPQNMLRWVLVELLGRSAVPLLGMISGWLVAASVSRRSWWSFVSGKARTLLVPMVLWNALAIVLVSGASYAGFIEAPLPTTLRWTIDELFCLMTPDDINVQMSFLRDLFVCMLAAPLLTRLSNVGLLAIGGAALAWSLSGVGFILLLRPAILFFFIVGILARRGNLTAWLAACPIVAMAIPYAGFAAAKVWLETAGAGAEVGHPMLAAALDIVMRLATALFFWSVAWRLAASRAAETLLRIEPYAFMLFCAHLIMIWLLGPLIGKLTGPLGSPLYPVFLLLHPALALMGTVALGRLLVNAAPEAALILSGGRLKPKESSVPVQAGGGCPS